MYIIIILLILITPSLSFAWGFETHIKIGYEVLKSTDYSLIKSFPLHFLTGNIFPDFFNLFKDISNFKKSLPTHSWSTVSSLIKYSENDAEKSFAHGYASHLSADIVAHNQMVPQNTLLLSDRKLFSHFLTEGAEAFLEKEYRHILLHLLENSHIYGESFLRIFNIEKKYFQKEMTLLQKGVKYQGVFKLQEIAFFIKKMRNPDFKEKCELFQSKAGELAKQSVEKGFQSLLRYDPSGKGSIIKAKKSRKNILSVLKKKHLKKYEKDNLFLDKYNPDKI